jgi:hypothetical protein
MDNQVSLDCQTSPGLTLVHFIVGASEVYHIAVKSEGKLRNEISENHQNVLHWCQCFEVVLVS